MSISLVIFGHFGVHVCLLWACFAFVVHGEPLVATKVRLEHHHYLWRAIGNKRTEKPTHSRQKLNKVNTKQDEEHKNTD